MQTEVPVSGAGPYCDTEKVTRCPASFSFSLWASKVEYKKVMYA